jgi:menaquinol-cytochrome c reductase iron-sulfur subunit
LSQHHDETPHVPAPSLWPIGFAIGLAVALIGLVVNVWVLLVGVVLAVVFGFLWVWDLLRAHGPVKAAAPGAPELPDEHAVPTYDRSAFLSAATIGIGAAIGGLVTVPVLGFAVLPSFESEDRDDIDLGPLANFPEGKYAITTFLQNPAQGEVSRRTAYIRNNGPTEEGLPSFTILFSRCVHLGCPVQANGPFDGDPVQYEEGAAPVSIQPVLAASFGCPCHGGLYDGEGNRTAGPPVRSLDRYEFSIKDGNLVLGRLFSVGDVQGTGASARIARYDQSYPGVHVDGIEAWLYPIPVPGSG